MSEVNPNYNPLKEEPVVEYQVNGIHKTIQDFERLYPELAEEFKATQQEQYELFAAKMMDYGKTAAMAGIWRYSGGNQKESGNG